MPRPQLAHRSARLSTPPILTKAIAFFPAKLSGAEIDFLLEHLEEPPTVALQGEMPEGVNPQAIEDVLVPMHDLEQLRLHRQLDWAGFDAVRDVCERYKAWDEFSRDIRAQGGPRHPSQHSWDGSGVMSTGTPGCDAAEMVKTEILEDGTRRDLYIADLRRSAAAKVRGPQLPWVKRAAVVDDELQHDATKGLLTCTVCGFTNSYDVSKGRVGINMARGQMARHLKSSRKEPVRHRALYRREFK